MTDVETGRRIDEHRAQRIRDITAQQWQTMCWASTVIALTAVSDGFVKIFDADGGLLPQHYASSAQIEQLGCDLRSAVDIVDGVA
jgi:hypothetical protein